MTDSTWRPQGRRLMRVILLVLFVLIALAAAASIWDWLQWRSSFWEWSGEAKGSETKGAALRDLLLFPLALIGIGLTVWRIWVAERTLSHSEERDRAGLLHRRYADASQGLSNESVSARMGAIYELQTLSAQDPAQLHVRTMKMLCAFVRFPPPEAQFDELADGDPCSRRLRPDVQAAMEVIGSRTADLIALEQDADYMPDLQGANLVRLELRDGNLSGIDFRGSRFWGADLMRADLSRSELQYTDFRSPWVVLGHDWTEITSQEGSFAQRGNAIMNSLTRLIGTDMSEAWMLQADLSGADLQGAKLGNANLPEVNFTRAFLMGVDLAGSEMGESNLTGAHLPGANTRPPNRPAPGPNSTTKRPPRGLTQAQLDQACADTANPPKLDESSGLVWHDRPCPYSTC